jgi:hypothetical protein
MAKKRLSQDLYKASRAVGWIEAFMSGDPKRVERKAVNAVKGKLLNILLQKTRFWK